MKTKSPKPAAKTSGKQTNVSGQGLAPPAYGINFVDRQNNSSDAAVQGVFESSPEETVALEENDKNPAAISSKSLPNKTGLPDNLKSGIENLSGYSMDNVKVHYNSDKPAQMQAHAFAQGTEIHLASGQEKHLPHEAWHIVQQKQGRVKPTMKMKAGVNVNDEAGLEKEADVMGARALQRKTEFNSGRKDSLSGDNGEKTFQLAKYTWDGASWISDGGSSSSKAVAPKPVGDFIGQIYNDSTGTYSTQDSYLSWITDEPLVFPPPSPDRDYSDSEPEDLEDQYKAIHNVTKKGRKKGAARIDNYVRQAQSHPNLNADATAIHDMIPKKRDNGKTNNDFGAITIITAVFMSKATKKVKKFAFINQPTMPPYLREKAESLGYHVVGAGQSHAEGELLQFLKVAREDYEFLSIGCDKPHCIECQWAMEQCVPHFHTQSGRDPSTAKEFKKYYMPHAYRKALGGVEKTEVATKRKLSVDRHKNKNKKKRKIDEYEES